MNRFKRRVCERNRELPRRSLVTETWGNVSGIDREPMEKEPTTDKDTML